MPSFHIGNRGVGDGFPVYFIAEIGANHDGSLERAFELIELAKRSGADCAKFQHYRADTLANRDGFEALKGNLAHYKGNPYDVFKRYEIPWEWTPQLKKCCDEVGIEFMSTPYDLEAVDHLNPYVNAFKVGSGDITYTELLRKIRLTDKPVLLSTGASTWDDVLTATSTIPVECLMQCNTNYSGVDDYNTQFYNLLWLQHMNTYLHVPGFSCHTAGTALPVSAMSLGARVIEAHLTDAKSSSPDSGNFAYDPLGFTLMVSDVQEAYYALGTGAKRVEDNEKDTVVLQRRALWAKEDIPEGGRILESQFDALRPCPEDAVSPAAFTSYFDRLWRMLGRSPQSKRDIKRGDYLRVGDI